MQSLAKPKRETEPRQSTTEGSFHRVQGSHVEFHPADPGQDVRRAEGGESRHSWAHLDSKQFRLVHVLQRQGVQTGEVTARVQTQG